MTTKINPMYQYTDDDARRFAKAHGEYKIADGTIILKYCPYCNGGTDRIANTYGIRLKDGRYTCKICNVKGDMTDLAKDFDFALTGQTADYYRSTEPKQIDNMPYNKISDEAKTILLEIGIYDAIKNTDIGTKINNASTLIIPYKDYKGQITGYQSYNLITRECKTETGSVNILHGMEYTSTANKTLIITASVIDALVLSTAGYDNIVSVPDGEKDLRWIPNCWDFIHNFEKIILCGTRDNNTIFLQDVQRRLNTIKILSANIDDYDYCNSIEKLYKQGGTEAVKKLIENSKTAPVAHITKAADINVSDNIDVQKIKTHIQSIDKTLHGGIPMGGLTIISGFAGEGKSTLLSQIIAGAIEQEHKCFLYSGEMIPQGIMATIMHQIAGPDRLETKTDDYGNVYGQLSKCNIYSIKQQIGDKLYIYDDTQSADDSTDVLLQTIINAITIMGCDVIVIDNLMSAMTMNGATGENENVRQTNFTDALRNIAMRYKVCVMLAAHRKKDTGTYKAEDNQSVSGTANIVNMASVVITFEKSNDIEKNQRYIRISKNRLYGTTLDSTILNYDFKSYRIYEDTETDNALKYNYKWYNK